MIRPRGPEPLRLATSTPSSLARRRANGEAKMRPALRPLTAAGCAPAAAAVRPAAGGLTAGLAAGLPGGGAAAARGAALWAAAGAGRAAGAGGGLLAGAAPAPSPSSSKVAIGVFTLTPSVPSATSSFDTLPSSTASTSMVALSVSISAMMSPGLTAWPSFTSHLASLPSSMVGDRAGIRISVGMRFPSLDQAKLGRRPFGFAAGDARLRAFPVIHHRLGHAILEGGHGQATHIEDRPGLGCILQHDAGVHAAAGADQTDARTRGELVAQQVGALDFDHGMACRVGDRHGAMARAKRALAGAHLQLRRRPGCPQRGADGAAVATALILMGLRHVWALAPLALAGVAALQVEHAFYGFDHRLGARQGKAFEIGRIGHRHIDAGDLGGRGIEIVEGLHGDLGADFRAHRADRPGFLDGDQPVGVLNRGDDGFEVERT